PSSTPEIYTLSLHDALPILTEPIIFEIGLVTEPVLGVGAVQEHEAGAVGVSVQNGGDVRIIDPRQAIESVPGVGEGEAARVGLRDRKSTRLNSSHVSISYAV